MVDPFRGHQLRNRDTCITCCALIDFAWVGIVIDVGLSSREEDEVRTVNSLKREGSSHAHASAQ
jgi:hypothetical protein